MREAVGESVHSKCGIRKLPGLSPSGWGDRSASRYLRSHQQLQLEGRACGEAVRTYLDAPAYHTGLIGSSISGKQGHPWVSRSYPRDAVIGSTRTFRTDTRFTSPSSIGVDHGAQFAKLCLFR
jgi:hypothetical protein